MIRYYISPVVDDGWRPGDPIQGALGLHPKVVALGKSANTSINCIAHVDGWALCRIDSDDHLPFIADADTDTIGGPITSKGISRSVLESIAVTSSIKNIAAKYGFDTAGANTAYDVLNLIYRSVRPTGSVEDL